MSINTTDLSNIKRDKEGYLINYNDWTESIALEIAKEENITVTEEHFLIIKNMRDYYIKYDLSPAMRPLVKILKQQYGETKGNSIYLNQLFPGGPAKQGNKIAGLPKPIRCI